MSQHAQSKLITANARPFLKQHSALLFLLMNQNPLKSVAEEKILFVDKPCLSINRGKIAGGRCCSFRKERLWLNTHLVMMILVQLLRRFIALHLGLVYAKSAFSSKCLKWWLFNYHCQIQFGFLQLKVNRKLNL